MNRRSALHDTVLIGCCFLAFLIVVGIFIALAMGEPPAAFLTDLFTDPLWSIVETGVSNA